MKKRNVFIGAILSLMSIGQPLIIKSGVVLSTTGLMLAFPQKVNAKSADKYFDIAYEMGNTGNYKGAIKNYTKVIELEPDNYIAYMNRGWNKANLGDDYAAISDYNKAIKIDPEYSIAYYNRAWSKEVIEDLKGSIADYTKAIKYNPKYFLAYINRGNIKNDMGDERAACKDYKKSISLGDTETANWLTKDSAKWCREMKF